MASFGYHHLDDDVVSPLERLKKKAAEGRAKWESAQFTRCDKRVENMIALLEKSETGMVHIETALTVPERQLLTACGIHFQNSVRGGANISFSPFPPVAPQRRSDWDRFFD